MDEDVGTGLEGTASLTLTLGMDPHWQVTPVCGTDHRNQRRVIGQRTTAVQHQFDQVVSMRGSLVDRAYAVRRPCQFTDRPHWSPGPIGRVSADGGQEGSGDPDQTTRGWIDLPAACDARHPAQVVNLDYCSVRQCGAVHQTKVDMSVDHARYERTSKLRYPSPLHGRTTEPDWPQLIVNLLKESRPESLADPEIVNSKPPDQRHWVPISVRTA
jgi:hypothetical protein